MTSTDHPTIPVAIVTGGSRGFGREVASVLVADGWHVLIDGRELAAVERAAAALGPTVHAVPGDVTDPRHRADLVRAAADLGGLDLLVNNASALGGSPLPRLVDLDPQVLVDLLRTNVVAPLALTQAALPLLRERAGAIIDVTSDAAVEAYEGWGGYGASKAALDHLSAVLAVEQPELRVWALDPGDMRTRMHQDAFPGEDISDRPAPETIAPAVATLVRKRPPSGRLRAADLLEGVAT